MYDNAKTIRDGSIKRFGSFHVVESPRLHWSKAYIDKRSKTLVCGEIAHVSYLIQMRAQREMARQDVDKILAKFARRVGVDWSPANR